MGPSGEVLKAWIVLVRVSMAQHSGRVLLGERGQLGEVGGVPPRGNDGVGGSDLPQPAPPPLGWAGA